MSAQLQYRIEQFLYHMAEVCDAQDWDRYLDLFSEDSEFHLPQWDSEHVYTTDPRKGMSLIYYPNRGGLEDRVYRLRTGKAASTIPMPRTLHLISNVRIAPAGEGANGQAGGRTGRAGQLAHPVLPPASCGAVLRTRQLSPAS
ncbi:Benzoate 1,2-dioxygenase beta subunit [Pseudomonas savastanoi]|uniref:Benzoate 1,2-dioxygenase beta subunit n=1 Tax=Pseudomonas savastanoi TaxID=29438 RepID=A0A3M5F2A4_PSESS|nr:Benzoate 1,2-dioxygenase beta subunit [Pseudomonas savastanoi]